VSLLDNRKYVETFARSRAGAAFVHPDIAGRAPSGMALLLTRQPYKAYALAAQAFHLSAPVRPGIAPSAVIAPDARLDRRQCRHRRRGDDRSRQPNRGQ
jgi:UDP-3-O-[3-hydroxymyristoyl] glucosamine N-acyltransferase